MKKFKLLIAPLLLIPVLASCNNGGGDKPEEVKFSLSGNPTIEGKVATVNVDWTPTNTIKFESFTFTTTPSKENTVTFDQMSDPRPMPVTITFKDDVTEDISGTLKFSYEDVTAKSKGESSLTFTIPKPSVDIHVVSEQEFNDACSFKNVQYLQVELTSVSEGTTCSSPIELSPTVSHMINESSTPSYYEIFVQKKSDGSYERAIREDKSKDEYSFESASESDFLTPQSTSVNVLIQLQHVGLSYSSFTYDSKAGTYSASFIPDGSQSSVTTTLKFENKILISDVSVGETGGTQTTTFTYEEKTPEYPEKPVDPTVTKDEFNAALAFEGVEYLQEENNSSISEGTKQISPSTYYEKSTMMSFLSEQYVYKVKEDIYKKISRFNSTTDWKNVKWETATEQELCTPQMVGESISEILTTDNVEEFDPEKYDATTQSYVLSGDTYNFAFKFENKKLVQFGDTDGGMTNTYTYEEITPQLPIDPPTPPEPGQEYTLTFYESDGQTQYTTVTITYENPTFTVPSHDEDEGTWEFTIGGIQGLTPGSKVTIPVEDLDDYDLVWTPQTDLVLFSI